MTPRELFSRATRLRPELSARQWDVLLAIGHAKEPPTVRGLAEGESFAKACITRTLDALAEEGFVERVVDTADRRSIFAVMTPKGKAFVRKLEAGA